MVASEPGQARGVDVDDALAVEETLDAELELPDTVELTLEAEEAEEVEETEETDEEDEETDPPVTSFAPQIAGALTAPPRVFLR